MWKTAIFLILSFTIISISSFYFDQAITGEVLETLHTLVLTSFFIAIICFMIGEITGNCSQVDKLWSILPIIYTFMVFQASGYQLRLGIMFILVFIWGARLTYNFSRRGGYHWIPWKGDEDYRWSVLRKKQGLNTTWGWRFFHLFFICIYQNALILLFTLPIIVAWQGTNPINALDIIAIILMTFFIIYETVADQQQYNFQQSKLDKNYSGKGFIDTGLWSKSRHPNYLSEQAIWISFYLFSIAATDRWINWSVSGGILLILLFKGSSDFSEGISSDKYPEYKEYQTKVPRFIPKLF